MAARFPGTMMPVGQRAGGNPLEKGMLVSMGMPCYNYAEYIVESIEAVLRQTQTDRRLEIATIRVLTTRTGVDRVLQDG